MFVAGTILAFLAVVAGVLAWRRNRMINDPANWPKNISVRQQSRLMKAMLRRDGWKMLPPDLALKVFVHAERDGLSAFLVIHNENTLGLPILLKESMGKVARTSKVLGIVTFDRLPEELATDAERFGLYLVHPANLKELAPMIQKAKARRKEVRAAGAREKGPVADSLAKSLTA